MPQNTELELRSEEVQEILTRVPHWMIRWGNLVVLIIILLLFVGAWIVKYPDIIKTNVVITTATPPEKLLARSSGRMEAILVKNLSIVKKGTPLAVVENSANYHDVFLLKSIIDTMQLSANNFPFELLHQAQLGDIEVSYAMFQKEYLSNELNKKLQPFKVEGAAQSYETAQLRERLNLLISQKSITESEIILQKKDLARYEGLFAKGIISAQEIEKQRLVNLNADKNYKNVLSTISQIKSSINDLNKNKKATLINENKDNSILERNVIQSFYQLKKTIKDWELSYVLRSSIEGKVTFLQIWTENQTVSSGDNVFAIIPKITQNYIGKVKAPAQNSGKIKIGQQVNIRLANYPDQEFGILNGKVRNISLTPDKEGNLLIDISLPQDLQTSYQKQISFQQEMSGTADIVTDDLRLIERLLSQFKDVFKR